MSMQVAFWLDIFKIWLDMFSGPIDIIGRAKRAPHWGVQSRFRVIYICWYICVSVVCQINCVGGITWIKHAHAQSQYWAVKSDQ